MRRIWIALPTAAVAVVAVLLAVRMSREPVEEGRCALRYHGNPKPNDSVVNAVANVLTPLPSRPEHVRDLPPGAEQAHFHRLERGKQPAITLCLSGDKLWVDTDGDGSFSNESCFVAVRRQQRDRSQEWKYGPIHLVSPPMGDQPAVFYILRYGEAVPAALLVRPAGYQVGKLRIEGRVYRVAAADGDYDGRFRSILSPPVEYPWYRTPSDLLAIDLDGDRKFGFASSARCDITPLSRMIVVKDKYYAVDLAADGSRLELRAVEPQMGELALDCPDAEFECRLLSDAAEQSLYFTYESKSRSLPVGTYGVVEGVLRARNAEGRQLLFKCDRPSSDLRCFQVKAGEVTTLKIGPPFVIGAEVRQVRDRVMISPTLRDRAGDVYAPTSSGHRSSFRPPTLSIVDEQGNCLHRGQFAFG